MPETEAPDPDLYHQCPPRPPPWGVSGARLTSYAHALMSPVRALATHPDFSRGDARGHWAYVCRWHAGCTITGQRDLESFLPSRGAAENLTEAD